MGRRHITGVPFTNMKKSEKVMAHIEKISLQEAFERIEPYAKVLPDEVVQFKDCGGRILRGDVTCSADEPSYRQSERDGYAVRKYDVIGASQDNPVTLKVETCNYAGITGSHALESGSAVRIMTGGVVPDGADAVIMKEDTDDGLEEVRIFKAASEKDYIRPIGFDMKKGDILVEGGTRLDAYNLFTCSVAGYGELNVSRKPVAGIISTGSELIPLGAERKPGMLYSSNDAFLRIRLEEEGCLAADENIFINEDDPDLIADSIRKLVDNGVDFLITSGGVAVGDKDYLPEAVERSGGQILFHGLEERKAPFTMVSECDGVLIFSMSGRPRTVQFGFEQIVLPVINKMTGRKR